MSGTRGCGWGALLALVGCAAPALPDPADDPSSPAASPGVLPGSGESPPGGEASETGKCERLAPGLLPQAADLLLVLDRSGSMLQNTRERGSGRFVQKWAEVVHALDVVIHATESGVAWGLKLYPDPDGCAVPDGMTVPAATGNHGAMLNGIRNHPAREGSGSSPTREAVRRAGAALLASPSLHSKYLLLATDGLPTCRTGAHGPEEDRQGTVEAIAELRAAGIPVFVVGIATLGSDAHAALNEMAEAGGRARQDPTRYYPVVSREQLVAALEAITGQIYGCPAGDAR